MIDCPSNATGEEAWDMFQAHLKALKLHYGSLHGASDRDAETTGAMAIHAAALTSGDKALSKRVEQLSSEQVDRIEHILDLCQRDGLIGPQVDIRPTAVLYVHSVWGLAQALFASPQAKNVITLAFEQFAAMLESLKIEQTR